MASRVLAGTFLAALAVPLFEAFFPELVLARGSCAALAFFPWLLVALAPRTRPARAPLGALLFVLALALPTLALGAGLDLARGAEPRALALEGGASLVVLALWCGAAELASGTHVARRAFATAWLVLLPGLAVLCFALEFVPRGRTPRGGLGDLWFALDPLVLVHRWGRAGGLGEHGHAQAVLALLGALLVLAMVLGLRRRRPEASA